MKQRSILFVLVLLLGALCVPPVFAQATGSIKGVAKDMDGKPIVGAVIELASSETGRKYTLKTNNKGEYFSLGIAPGRYTVTLSKDGKVVDKVNNFPVSLDEAHLDFDMKVSQQQAAQQQGVNPEQLKQMQEQQSKAQKETLTVKALNEKLAAANTASQAGNYDEAVTILTDATNMDATRDLLWFKLGDAYRMSATKQTDAAEKQKRLDSAIQAYQKAIQIKSGEAAPAAGAPGAPAAAPAARPGQPSSNQQLAAYYNNIAEAYARSGKLDDAIKNYNQAAQVNPASAAQYHFNAGAVLTNVGKSDDAIAEFDKAIAADPNKADAYYQKGVNLLAKATLKGEKMEAPPGTAEAFQKYLELAPDGPLAQPAKDMLASIGASVETQYGKKKASKK